MLEKFYHSTIRKAIISFGNLFNNMYVDRKNATKPNATLALAHFDRLKKSMKLDNEVEILTETNELVNEYNQEVDSLTNE